MYEKISELAARYTKVTWDPVSGKHFGSCPFCHGRTDTFMADDRKGIFFCYACGASGDKKDFLSRLEPQKHGMMTGQKNPLLLQIYEEAAYFYYTELTKADHPGRQYLADRGISMDGIREYGLGFAPDGFSILYSRMIRRYRHGELMASGLFKLSARGYPYDFFRNRIMFPIMDENGDVIAFGGRVLDDSRPKYLNSPETELFSKRRNLYGFPYVQDARGIRTWIYIDELYVLTQSESCARFLIYMWKQFRKYGGVPTGITQNIEDLLMNRESRGIINNSPFILMLNQSAEDRNEIGAMLHISEAQLNYIKNADSGQGLIYSGKAIVPFINKFPHGNLLYRVISTNPNDQAGGAAVQ